MVAPWGIICPMVNNAKEAKALADACLYPPIGKRSNGPIRAAAYGEASMYQTIANDEVLVIAMIETQDGIDNIDEILSVPGHQRHLYRSGGHGFSLGLVPKLDREEPLIMGIYEKLLASCKKHGKFPGLHNATPAYAARMIDMGFRFRHHRERQRVDGEGRAEAVAETRKIAGAGELVNYTSPAAESSERSGEGRGARSPSALRASTSPERGRCNGSTSWPHRR